MKPIKFEQANKNLLKPESMTEGYEGCYCSDCVKEIQKQEEEKNGFDELCEI